MSDINITTVLPPITHTEPADQNAKSIIKEQQATSEVGNIKQQESEKSDKATSVTPSYIVEISDEGIQQLSAEQPPPNNG